MYKAEESGKGGIEAKIVEDSIYQGNRLLTLQLKFPRFIHAEFMTHRVFSRNASSSRAIPVEKVIEQVTNNPAMPIHWGSNKPGMQAGAEVDAKTIKSAKNVWLTAAGDAVKHAESLMNMGLHKQVANRLLEPFQFMQVVVTSTEWKNWFKLRNHDAADPNIHELARVMQIVVNKSEPKVLEEGEYHLPYILETEKEEHELDDIIKASVARCARVSYLNHDKTDPDFKKDVGLHDMLKDMGHMSPFEHVATPSTISNDQGDIWYGNFKNWIQWRKIIEDEL